MGQDLSPALDATALDAAAQGAADADVQSLLKEIMPVTRTGLETKSAFSPLAAVVERDGTIRRIESEVEAATPIKDALDRLRSLLRQQVATGTVRAAAVAADVRMWRREDGDEASDAVSIHVEHQNGYCVDLLIPYKVRKGLISRLRSKPQVIFRTMVAQQGQPLFWAAPGS